MVGMGKPVYGPVKNEKVTVMTQKAIRNDCWYKIMGWLLIFLAGILIAGCDSSQVIPIELTTVPATAPATLPEVIKALSSDLAEARITAARALPKYGKEAVKAIPALIENLNYEPTSDVRLAAAYALRELGPDAQSAVPALIEVVKNDDTENVRIAAIDALGRIGDPSAVPTLASVLYEEDDPGRNNIWLTIPVAESIALLTGKDFLAPDEPLMEDGEAPIVVQVREWWEKEGRYLNWKNKK